MRHQMLTFRQTVLNDGRRWDGVVTVNIMPDDETRAARIRMDTDIFDGTGVHRSGRLDGSIAVKVSNTNGKVLGYQYMSGLGLRKPRPDGWYRTVALAAQEAARHAAGLLAAYGTDNEPNITDLAREVKLAQKQRLEAALAKINADLDQ